MGGALAARAGHSWLSRLGVFAFIGALASETADTYSLLSRFLETITGGVSGSLGFMFTLHAWAVENPLLSISIVVLLLAKLWESQGVEAPSVSPPPPPPVAAVAPTVRDPVVHTPEWAERMLQDQRDMRLQFLELQGHVGRSAAPLGPPPLPPPAAPVAPPTPAPAPADALVERLLHRLERMESTIREDAGAGRRAGAEAAPVPAAPVAPPTPAPPALMAPVEARPALATPADPAPVGEVAAGSGALAIEAVIAQLERSTQSPHAAFLRQLRRFREIPASEWPMPMGYQKRLAPSYLAEVYRDGTAVQYARRWLQEHGLQRNAPAQEMVAIMESVDDSILVDERDVINSLAFEKLVRRAYGLERAFEECRTEPDWKRQEGKKGWVTKVKWDLCDRYDVRGTAARGGRVPAVDEEARQAMERDAAFHKWYSKAGAVLPGDPRD